MSLIHTFTAIMFCFLLSSVITVSQTGSDVLYSRFALQEGAEGVVHSGQVQVLGMLALRLRLWFLVVLLALTGERVLPPDRGQRPALQALEDHVGEVLLEPLEVLPGKAGAGFKEVTLK